jgi:septal ring factor EnvC (AmiA/AmiB activator)
MASVEPAMQNGRVFVSLETWVSIGALLTVGLTLYATIRKTGRDVRSELKDDIAAVRTDLAATRTELKADIAAVRTELKADIAAVRTELAATRTELKADIAVVRTELAATRTELKADVGRLDDRVYALAAGLRPTLDEHPSTPAVTGDTGRN